MAVHGNHGGASREPHWRFTEAALAVKGNHAGDSRKPTQNGVVAVVKPRDHASAPRLSSRRILEAERESDKRGYPLIY